MESVLITTPLRCCARRSASADLPLAVGPASSTALSVPDPPMSLVATLICNPADPALDSTIVEGARAALPSPNEAHWLSDGVAADIFFSSDNDMLAIADRLRASRGDLAIDIVVQPAADRRKKLFLAD